MAVLCMHIASGHNYRNSSFIVDWAMGQMPRSTERMAILLNASKLIVSEFSARGLCGDFLTAFRTFFAARRYYAFML